jgi:hypothetical protein
VVDMESLFGRRIKRARGLKIKQSEPMTTSLTDIS